MRVRIILLAVFLAGCSSVAKVDFAATGVMRGGIGHQVILLPISGNQGIAGMLQQELVRNGIEVVDRHHLKDQFKELRLQHSGAVRKSKILELGRMESASVIISGRCDARFLGVELRLVLTSVESGLVVGTFYSKGSPRKVARGIAKRIGIELGRGFGKVEEPALGYKDPALFNRMYPWD